MLWRLARAHMPWSFMSHTLSSRIFWGSSLQVSEKLTNIFFFKCYPPWKQDRGVSDKGEKKQASKVRSRRRRGKKQRREEEKLHPHCTSLKFWKNMDQKQEARNIVKSRNSFSFRFLFFLFKKYVFVVKITFLFPWAWGWSPATICSNQCITSGEILDLYRLACEITALCAASLIQLKSFLWKCKHFCFTFCLFFKTPPMYTHTIMHTSILERACRKHLSRKVKTFNSCFNGSKLEEKLRGEKNKIKLKR